MSATPGPQADKGEKADKGGKRKRRRGPPLSDVRHDTAADLARPENRKRVATAQYVWNKATPIAGTMGEAYLRAQGVTGDLPPTLRFAPAMPHPAGDIKLPGIVAARQGADRQITGLWRVFLTEDGELAAVTPGRMNLGYVRGTAVRFGPAAEEIVVAGDIEHALQVRDEIPEMPIWAGLNSFSWRALELPAEVRRVTIVPDMTPCPDWREPKEHCGYAAAQALQRRVQRMGRASRIIAADPSLKPGDQNA